MECSVLSGPRFCWSAQGNTGNETWPVKFQRETKPINHGSVSLSFSVWVWSVCVCDGWVCGMCVSVQNSTQIVRDQLSGIGLDHSTLFWGQGAPSVLWLHTYTRLAGPRTFWEILLLLPPFLWGQLGLQKHALGFYVGLGGQLQVFRLVLQAASDTQSHLPSLPQWLFTAKSTLSCKLFQLHWCPVFCTLRVAVASTAIGGRPVSTIWRHILIFISE